LSTIGRWQERWTHWFYRNIPFWVPSESTKAALHAEGVREVAVFPNGTDTAPLAELEPKPLVAPLRLIAVSRLAPNKRVDHVIEVVLQLRRNGVQAQLTIVGSGEVEQHLRDLAAQPELAGHVMFTGQLGEKEKNARLREAHFLVHASLREGWGLNVIEANAMGTPAIVYPVGGLVDSTVHNQTGIISASETPQAIASALTDLVKTPEQYTRLRTNAWERSKTFAWNKVLAPVCDWLENQAKRARPGN